MATRTTKKQTAARASAGRTSARKTAARSSARRELVDTGTDERYVKRRASGTFKESDDVGASLAADRRQAARSTTRAGYGDQGDRPRRKKSAKKR
jgi:hypothetical protein